jgi:haloacetate dehalogenase
LIFEGFALEEVDVGGARLRVRHGGAGPAVGLLHGHPRTHTTWHAVAPILARDFTVVCPDLRGYGESSKPPGHPDHSQMSKRALAGDVVSLMLGLGYERFALVGHDRGAYVAFRAAMDHPERVTRLVVMDAVPIGEALRRTDARFASRWWHWFFFGQTVKPAERMINADPDAWYQDRPELMGIENHADFRRAVHNPETVHAMLEDYRAGLTVDRAADDEDHLRGRRLRCPVLFLWATGDDMADLYGDPVAIWRDWADEVSGSAIDSGHHMAEEAPETVAAAIRDFLLPS